MTDPATCGCGQPADTIVIIHGFIAEKCGDCARRLCDPLGTKQRRKDQRCTPSTSCST